MAMNRSALSFGTCGGLLFGIYPSLLIGDVTRTIVLAAIGAIVSFFVSLVLAILIRKKD